MAVITIATQKGGTGKTTLAWGLGGALHDIGRSVLYVDMDGQQNLSWLLRSDDDKPTVYDVLMGRSRAAAAIQPTYQGDLIAANYALSGLDAKLTGKDRLTRLRNALQDVAPRYDYVLIDTPPALALATMNALAASDGVIIPTTAELFALYGMDAVISAVKDVRRMANPDLQIYGVSLGQWDGRTAISKAYLHEIEERAKAANCPIYNTKIRKGVAIPEAQSGCKALTSWAPKSNQAKDYAALAEEVSWQLL